MAFLGLLFWKDELVLRLRPPGISGTLRLDVLAFAITDYFESWIRINLSLGNGPIRTTWNHCADISVGSVRPGGVNVQQPNCSFYQSSWLKELKQPRLLRYSPTVGISFFSSFFLSLCSAKVKEKSFKWLNNFYMLSMCAACKWFKVRNVGGRDESWLFLRARRGSPGCSYIRYSNIAASQPWTRPHAAQSKTITIFSNKSTHTPTKSSSRQQVLDLTRQILNTEMCQRRWT